MMLSWFTHYWKLSLSWFNHLRKPFLSTYCLPDPLVGSVDTNLNSSSCLQVLRDPSGEMEPEVVALSSARAVDAQVGGEVPRDRKKQPVRPGQGLHPISVSALPFFFNLY